MPCLQMPNATRSTSTLCLFGCVTPLTLCSMLNFLWSFHELPCSAIVGQDMQLPRALALSAALPAIAAVDFTALSISQLVQSESSVPEEAWLFWALAALLQSQLLSCCGCELGGCTLDPPCLQPASVGVGVLIVQPPGPDPCRVTCAVDAQTIAELCLACCNSGDHDVSLICQVLFHPVFKCCWVEAAPFCLFVTLPLSGGWLLLLAQRSRSFDSGL